MELQPLIPLGQTILWIGFAAALLFGVRIERESLFGVLFRRVKAGAPFSLAGLEIGSPPAEIRRGEHVGVTSEGRQGATLPLDIADLLQRREYPANVAESPYLVHESQIVRPRTEKTVGLYRVRVRLEADSAPELQNVRRVTYRLHETFPHPTLATEAREEGFELWINVYGEFTVVAVVERDGLSPLWLTRYINLPGRPPD
jgi:hypothetical protein